MTVTEVLTTVDVSELTPLYVESTRGAFLDSDGIIHICHTTRENKFEPEYIPLRDIFLDTGYVRVSRVSLSSIYAYDGKTLDEFQDTIADNLRKAQKKSKERTAERIAWQKAVENHTDVVVGIDSTDCEPCRGELELYLVLNTNYNKSEQKKYLRTHGEEWLTLMVRELKKSNKVAVLNFLRGCYVKSVRVT
jgi:hypothetical protein